MHFDDSGMHSGSELGNTRLGKVTIRPFNRVRDCKGPIVSVDVMGTMLSHNPKGTHKRFHSLMAYELSKSRLKSIC